VADVQEKSCLSLLQTIRESSTPNVDINPVTSSGESDETRRNAQGYSPVECLEDSGDLSNAARTNFYGAAAEELGFTIDPAFVPHSSIIPAGGSGVFSGLNADDKIATEGIQEALCPGDEIYQFAISSTGVKTVGRPDLCPLVGEPVETCRFRYRNIQHRVVLHVRQTFDPTDDCPSELCFDTNKYVNITGTTAGFDGIACYDAELSVGNGYKWFVDPDTLASQRWMLNGEEDREIIFGTDLILLSDNTQGTAACLRCDEVILEQQLGSTTELRDCASPNCRVCSASDYVTPTSTYSTDAAIRAACSNIEAALLSNGLSTDPPLFFPGTSTSTGCPVGDNTCPLVLDPDPVFTN